MKGRTFLIMIFLLAAAAAHISYILFVPSGQSARRLTDYTSQHGSNNFTVLSPERSGGLFEEVPSDTVVAVCAFNLAGGPVRISAPVTGRYWSISVYTPAGEILYTLNDRQAASNMVELVVSDQSRPDAKDTDASPVPSGPTPLVHSPNRTGFVSIRSAVDLPEEAPYRARQLAVATCSS